MKDTFELNIYTIKHMEICQGWECTYHTQTQATRCTCYYKHTLSNLAVDNVALSVERYKT